MSAPQKRALGTAHGTSITDFKHAKGYKINTGQWVHTSLLPSGGVAVEQTTWDAGIFDGSASRCLALLAVDESALDGTACVKCALTKGRRRRGHVEHVGCKYAKKASGGGSSQHTELVASSNIRGEAVASAAAPSSGALPAALRSFSLPLAAPLCFAYAPRAAPLPVQGSPGLPPPATPIGQMLTPDEPPPIEPPADPAGPPLLGQAPPPADDAPAFPAAASAAPVAPPAATETRLYASLPPAAPLSFAYAQRAAPLPVVRHGSPDLPPPVTSSGVLRTITNAYALSPSVTPCSRTGPSLLQDGAFGALPGNKLADALDESSRRRESITQPKTTRPAHLDPRAVASVEAPNLDRGVTTAPMSCELPNVSALHERTRGWCCAQAKRAAVVSFVRIGRACHRHVTR